MENELLRRLTKNEFKRMNKEIAYDDLEIGMEITIDDTTDAGWYRVVSFGWNFVELEMLEVED